MAKTRTFIAVAVSPEIQSGANELTDALAPHTDSVRWIADRTLHYTLQFLGDISDQEIADVCLRVGRVADATTPFLLQAVGAGAFPSTDRPRTLWIGAGQGAEQMASLQADMEEALNDLGFRGERRRYVPHLTIGKADRARSAATELSPALIEHRDFDAGSMVVEEVTVFASELSREGPEYHALARCPLRG